MAEFKGDSVERPSHPDNSKIKIMEILDRQRRPSGLASRFGRAVIDSRIWRAAKVFGIISTAAVGGAALGIAPTILPILMAPGASTFSVVGGLMGAANGLSTSAIAGAGFGALVASPLAIAETAVTGRDGDLRRSVTKADTNNG